MVRHLLLEVEKKKELKQKRYSIISEKKLHI